jgi:hypothetical protein
VLWLFVVGVAIGIVVTLVAVVRLPRGEADVSDQERHTEATWISDIIERHGGVAPVLLVEEVLELHQAYLRETCRAGRSCRQPGSTPGPGHPPTRPSPRDRHRLAIRPHPRDRPQERARLRHRDPDDGAHHERDQGCRAADEDLAHAAVEQPTTGQEAHEGADDEEGAQGQHDRERDG